MTLCVIPAGIAGIQTAGMPRYSALQAAVHGAWIPAFHAGMTSESK
jgi:hypothetical protein